MLVLAATRLRYYCLTHPSVMIVVGWAALITIGYVYSGYSGDGFQRYFCPPGMMCSLGLVCLIHDFAPPRAILRAAGIVLVLGIGLNSASLARSYSQGLTITSAPGQSIAAIERRYAALAKRYTGIPIMEGFGLALYYRNIDWIAADLGIEGAKKPSHATAA